MKALVILLSVCAFVVVGCTPEWPGDPSDPDWPGWPDEPSCYEGMVEADQGDDCSELYALIYEGEYFGFDPENDYGTFVFEVYFDEGDEEWEPNPDDPDDPPDKDPKDDRDCLIKGELWSEPRSQSVPVEGYVDKRGTYYVLSDDDTCWMGTITPEGAFDGEWSYHHHYGHFDKKEEGEFHGSYHE